MHVLRVAERARRIKSMHGLSLLASSDKRTNGLWSEELCNGINLFRREWGNNNSSSRSNNFVDNVNLSKNRGWQTDDRLALGKL